MKERIKDKIKEIEQYLEELEEIIPESLEEYSQNFKTKAACERYIEVIVEAVVDLAFLLIKEKGLEIPENDVESFFILAKNKVIPFDLAHKFREAKGMRNLLAHQYGKIDDEIVYSSLKSEFLKDVEEFIKNIEKELFK